jgi:oligopeptide transport system substrate-binding protein
MIYPSGITGRGARPRRWRFAAVVWLLGSLVALLLLGCTKRALSNREAPVEILRLSQRNEPTDLDPATASLPDEFFIIRALGEGLLVPNPAGGRPLPGAATGFDVSPDGLTYTFHLRADAQWSNGEPVTAQDFVASYRRVLSPATAAPKAHLFFAVKNARAFVAGAVKDFDAVGIRAPDPHTLVVTLTHPLRSFPLYVASGPWIPVNPRVVAEFERTWTHPAHFVGNGPFVLTEWRQQQRIVVRKNPRYRDAALVALDEIQFIRYDSADAEERAYRAGQIDVTMAVPQSKLDLYAREQPAELHRMPLAETRFIAFNTTGRPLNDERVRRALSLAIDRQRIVTNVLRGGQQPADRFLSPALMAGRDVGSSPSSTATGEPPSNRADTGQSLAPHDAPPAGAVLFAPAEARRLLAAAGYPNGQGFPALELAGWDRGNATLDVIQQMWRRELGIEVRIVVQDAKVHLAALTSGNYDVAFVTNLLDTRDPVAALQDYTSEAPNNFPHWRDADYDGLVETAATASNAVTAATALASAEARLLDAGAVAPVYFNTQNWLMSPRVHGWQQDALWSRRYNDLHVDPP